MSTGWGISRSCERENGKNQGCMYADPLFREAGGKYPLRETEAKRFSRAKRLGQKEVVSESGSTGGKSKGIKKQ